MGTKVQSYCDGCGADVGDCRIGWDVIQITAFGSNGQPAQMFLCIDPEPVDYEVHPEARVLPPRIRGCARKVLTKSILPKLYEEVAEYVGNEDDKPFVL